MFLNYEYVNRIRKKIDKCLKSKIKQHITTMVYYHVTTQEASRTVCSAILSDC